jgi:hypothetical protein
MPRGMRGKRNESPEEIRTRLKKLSPEALESRREELEQECPGITEHMILVVEFLREYDSARSNIKEQSSPDD